jgi:hypothetical protein
MIDSNGLDIMVWYYLAPSLQELVVNLWEKESRVLTDEERVSLQVESNNYWSELHQLEEENSDK